MCEHVADAKETKLLLRNARPEVPTSLSLAKKDSVSFFSLFVRYSPGQRETYHWAF